MYQLKYTLFYITSHENSNGNCDKNAIIISLPIFTIVNFTIVIFEYMIYSIFHYIDV